MLFFLLLMNLPLLVFAVPLVVCFFCCIWLLLTNRLIAVGLQVKKDVCVLERVVESRDVLIFLCFVCRRERK